MYSWHSNVSGVTGNKNMGVQSRESSLLLRLKLSRWCCHLTVD